MALDEHEPGGRPEAQLHPRVGGPELRLGARHEDELEARALGPGRYVDRGAVGREGLVEEREAPVGAQLAAGRGGRGRGVRILRPRRNRQDARRAGAARVREQGGEDAVDEHVAREAGEPRRKSGRNRRIGADAGGVRAAGVKLARSSERRFAYFQFSSREPGSPAGASASMAARRRAAPGAAPPGCARAFACSSAIRAVRGLSSLPQAAAPLTQS